MYINHVCSFGRNLTPNRIWLLGQSKSETAIYMKDIVLLSKNINLFLFFVSLLIAKVLLCFHFIFFFPLICKITLRFLEEKDLGDIKFNREVTNMWLKECISPYRYFWSIWVNWSSLNIQVKPLGSLFLYIKLDHWPVLTPGSYKRTNTAEIRK